MRAAHREHTLVDQRPANAHDRRRRGLEVDALAPCTADARVVPLLARPGMLAARDAAPRASECALGLGDDLAARPLGEDHEARAPEHVAGRERVTDIDANDDAERVRLLAIARDLDVNGARELRRRVPGDEAMLPMPVAYGHVALGASDAGVARRGVLADGLLHEVGPPIAERELVASRARRVSRRGTGTGTGMRARVARRTVHAGRHAAARRRRRSRRMATRAECMVLRLLHGEACLERRIRERRPMERRPPLTRDRCVTGLARRCRIVSRCDERRRRRR